MKKILLLFFVFLVVIGLNACKHNVKLHDPVIVDHRGEAGAVLLSVNSTIPWSDAALELEPKFDMQNGDVALNKVVRATTVLRRQVLDAFGVGLGVGLPQTSTTASELVTSNTQTVTSLADGVESETKTQTDSVTTSDQTEKKPGEAPETPSTNPPSTDFPQPIQQLEGDSVDPFLEYKAAQSLFHTVKLLNAEVRNAAVREGYVPHVVILKLTPMLYQRDLPYDIHAKVSFFNGGEMAKEKSFNLPYVVPILATDSLERAIKSNAVEISRQVGLALNAMVQGVGVEAGLDKLNRDLDAIEANDFNSLLTVGRLTDNSLYIRLGAANQATARFATIGKTYDIAALVLVPKEFYSEKGKGTQLSVISHTEFRNAFTGIPLQTRPVEDVIREIDSSIGSVLGGHPEQMAVWNEKSSQEKLIAATKLSTGVQRSDWNLYIANFAEIILGKKSNDSYEIKITEENGKITFKKSNDLSEKSIHFDTGYLQTLWLRIAGLMADGSYKGASVEIRPLTALKIPSQVVVLADSGEKGMEAVLRNVTGARPGGFSARLVYAMGSEFPAEKVIIAPDTELLRLKFPSPKPWKLNPKDSKLIIESATCDWDKACPKNDIQSEYPLVYLPIDKPSTPKLSLRSTLKVIVTEKGNGGMTLFIEDLKEDGVTLTVEGARITGAKDSSTEKDFVVNMQRVVLTTNGGVDFTLDNLQPGVKVTAKATGMKQDKKTKKFTATGTKSVEFEVVKAK